MIACLLPARNAAADIPGWLESIERFADAAIALDDGSTDATAELLEASPLVAELLRNPRRPSYAGWDDSANRQRLLDAARERGFDWVLYLDADERIDADDAEALRRFVEGDALPGCAYCLRMYRAWDQRVVAEPTYVYRLFAVAPRQTMPGFRLDFTPVPVEIPAAVWLPTTIRARHLDSPSRLAARRAKYAQADPGGELRRAPTVLDSEPRGELAPWGPRTPGLPVLAPPDEMPRAVPARARLACLLPARNAAADIPGWLESIERFADAAIALDDGSTDATAELLEASPLVAELLRNPRRPSYAGWDDSANRQRLLDAARERGFDWVLYLDADERIDADDAEALRRFVNGGPDPACAYGFRVFRMVGDQGHFDRSELWVYRLFSPAAAGALPRRRLHLVPVPKSIPRGRWRRTTVRVKHLGSLTASRRESRLAKYEQADPERRWQRDYAHLVVKPAAARAWRPRPSELPVLLAPGARVSDLDLWGLDPAPLLSAIVISRDNEATIERSVRSVVEQECPFEFEVIVAVSGSDRTAQVVRERFPEARVVDVQEPGLPGMARNAGLAVARGEYVSFPGSHVELPPGSLAARVRAHEAGWPMVTGTVHNGTRTRAGWAGYFLDNSTSLPGRPSGQLDAAPAHCSYAREFLLEAGGFPERLRAGEDTVVNRELWRQGRRAYRARDLKLVHRNPCPTVGRLVAHHFRRGRALGRIMRGEPRDEAGGAYGRRPAPVERRSRSRRALVAYLLRYPRLRLELIDGNVARWGDGLRHEYARARPLVALGISAAAMGALAELCATPGSVVRPLGPRISA